MRWIPSYQRWKGATRLHGSSPESYDAARKVLEIMGYKPSDIITGVAKGISESLSSKNKLREKFGSKHGNSKSDRPSMKQLAEAANIGEYTLKDIFE